MKEVSTAIDNIAQAISDGLVSLHVTTPTNDEGNVVDALAMIAHAIHHLANVIKEKDFSNE